MGRDQTHAAELTGQIRTDALLTVVRVNNLLADAGIDHIFPGTDQITGTPVASGWRPQAVNDATAHHATGSKHTLGQAVDIQDQLDRRLAVWCVSNPQVMERCQLWMEDPRWCAGKTGTDPWVHLQTVPPGSGRRVFIPYKDTLLNPPTDPDFYIRNRLKAP